MDVKPGTIVHYHLQDGTLRVGIIREVTGYTATIVNQFGAQDVVNTEEIIYDPINGLLDRLEATIDRIERVANKVADTMKEQTNE